ncbi:class I SAM-dependent methyltransferase [candidate division KSB1 bacterium]|nr:class I SAM-dependent methyltransferase [candidate division KSB1 bacterium]
MPTLNKNTNKNDWFKYTFQDDYLYLYADHDDGEAKDNINLAVEHVPYRTGQKILDIACGTGRHLQAFAEKGAHINGIDISDTMLMHARNRFKKLQIPVRLENQDMRQIRYNKEFDGITIWFTSFGYFTDSEQDRIVLQNIQKALKPDGWWWIDLVNPQDLINTLIPDTTRKIIGPNGNAHVKEKRCIKGNRVEKIIEISDRSGKRTYAESVRLYTVEDFSKLLKDCGLTSTGILGDYSGGQFTSMSPRQIWYGEK